MNNRILHEPTLSVVLPVEEADCIGTLHPLGAPAPDRHADARESLQLRILQQEVDRTLGLVERTEQQLHHAEANLNRARQILAILGEQPQRPTTPWVLVVLAAGAIALTFTLSFHDLVFANLIPNPMVALYASFASALLISGLLVYALIYSASLETRVSKASGASWVVVMLGVAVALLLIRWSSAHTVGALRLALGMSLLEAFLAISTERVAARLRHAWRQHRLDIEAWEGAARQVHVATGWRDERRVEHGQAVKDVRGLLGR